MGKWLWAVLLTGCPSDDTETKTSGATGETGTSLAALTVLGDGTNLPPAALLSVWGSGNDDVFTVGADDGTGPVVLHWDGTAWTRLDTQTTGDLWWVWSAGGDKVWMSGEGGRVVTYSRKSGTFDEDVIADSAYKLFGIWGTADDNVYTVAGEINNALDGAVYHYNGTSWTLSTLVPRKDAWPTEPKGGAVQRRQAFKVWGSGPNDVWVVGTLGMAMHYDGKTWTDWRPEPVNSTTTMTTVNGCGTDLAYAVGGFGNAIVGRWDGAAWADDSPLPQAIVPFFNGVYVTCPGEQVVACGGGGAIYWRTDKGWVPEPRDNPSSRDLHACWIDDAGDVWAVGGDLTNQTEGAIIYGGVQVEPVSGL